MINNMKKERIEEKISYYFLGSLIIFIVTFSKVCKQIEMSGADWLPHIDWAMVLDEHIFHYMSEYISYPIWHIVFKIIYKIFNFDIKFSASGATALLNCFAGGGILYAWDYLSAKPTASKTKMFWTICILLMGPLYAPGFNADYYLGQGSGNVWHNPTHIAVKGFAILCFVWIVRLVNDEIEHKRWEYVLLSVLLLLSVLAKPSFLQAMIPGLGLYFIIELLRDGLKKHIVPFFYIAITFVPSVIILIMQFVINFYTDSSIHKTSGIGIAYGAVLLKWTDNLFYSCLLALAFPLFVLLMYAKRLLKDTSVKIAMCYGLCAWLQAAFLYEKGERMLDGNWTWGWNLSLLIIWMLFVIKFFEIIQDETISFKKKALSLFFGMPILFFHVIFGIIMSQGIGL